MSDFLDAGLERWWKRRDHRGVYPSIHCRAFAEIGSALPQLGQPIRNAVYRRKHITRVV
jgi:hypothetical protein